MIRLLYLLRAPLRFPLEWLLLHIEWCNAVPKLLQHRFGSPVTACPWAAPDEDMELVPRDIRRANRFANVWLFRFLAPCIHRNPGLGAVCTVHDQHPVLFSRWLLTAFVLLLSHGLWLAPLYILRPDLVRRCWDYITHTAASVGKTDREGRQQPIFENSDALGIKTPALPPSRPVSVGQIDIESLSVDALLENANKWIAAHQWPSARDALTEVVVREPDHSEARVRLGNVCLAQFALDDADRFVGPVLADDLPNLAAIRVATRSALLRGEIEKAAGLLQRACDVEDGADDDRRSLTRLAIRIGDTEAATALSAWSPDDPVIRWTRHHATAKPPPPFPADARDIPETWRQTLLVENLLVRKEWPQLEDAFSIHIKRHPDRHLFHLHVLDKVQQTAGKERVVRMARAMTRQESSGCRALGHGLLARNYFADSLFGYSADHSKRALEAQPAWADIRHLNGRALFGQKNYFQAAIRFREVLQQSPGSYIDRLYLANCYLYDFKPDEGKAVLEQLIEDHPKRLEAYNALATWHLAADRKDEALNILRNAQRSSPENGTLSVDLVRVLLLIDAGRYSSEVAAIAWEVFERDDTASASAIAALMRSNTQPYLESRGLELQSRVLLQEDRPGPALRKANESIAIDGNNAGGHHAAALCLQALQRLDEAQASVAEALRIDPRHAGARELKKALATE